MFGRNNEPSKAAASPSPVDPDFSYGSPEYFHRNGEQGEMEMGAHNIESGDNSAIDPDSGVKRGLKNRHLSMMALAGIIGPGLLVGAGGALNSGGPASLIIGFGVIGMSSVAMQT